MKSFIIVCFSFFIALQVPAGSGFVAPSKRAPMWTLHSTAEDAVVDDPKYVEAIPILSTVTDPQAVRLRTELLRLAEETKRGFYSSASQKKRAREIIAELSKFNPTLEPAAPYYEKNSDSSLDDDDGAVSSSSLAGKWDLVYTDAPDITSLDSSRWNPLPSATLGRIGQECSPPYIKNVIEWKKPEWADRVPLPFAGTKDSFILQKVCTKATASPDNPMVVNLEVAGLELVAPPTTAATGNNNLPQDIQEEGLPVGLLRNNPLELRGPLTAPFGKFEVLYLDEELRIIKTNQNFLAVNRRATEEWF